MRQPLSLPAPALPRWQVWARWTAVPFSWVPAGLVCLLFCLIAGLSAGTVFPRDVSFSLIRMSGFGMWAYATVSMAGAVAPSAHLRAAFIVATVWTTLWVLVIGWALGFAQAGGVDSTPFARLETLLDAPIVALACIFGVRTVWDEHRGK